MEKVLCFKARLIMKRSIFRRFSPRFNIRHCHIHIFKRCEFIIVQSVCTHLHYVTVNIRSYPRMVFVLMMLRSNGSVDRHTLTSVPSISPSWEPFAYSILTVVATLQSSSVHPLERQIARADICTSSFYLQRQRRSTIDENCCCCSCWDEVILPAAFVLFLVPWMSFFFFFLLLLLLFGRS